MSKNREMPVFFDPDRKRWPRLRGGVYISGLVLSLLFGVLIVSILLNPSLPKLGLPQSSFLPTGGHVAPPAPQQILTPRQRAIRDAKRKIEQERTIRKVSFSPLITETPTGAPITAAFYVNWDDASMSSLKENLENPFVTIDMVIGEFAHLADGTGNIREDNPDRQAAATNLIRSHKPATRIFALVNNFKEKEWEADKLRQMLADPAARSRVVQWLFDYVQANNFAGVSVDFENLANESQPMLVDFMSELYAKLHPAGLEISMNVPASNDAFDYKKLASLTDYLILMAYDEHWAPGKPGSICGLDWFRQVLRERTAEIPASKMIVAVGNYAYDWMGTDEPGAKTFEEAVLTASESSTPDDKVDVHFDSDSLNPTFNYEDEKGNLHNVWFLDAVTAFNQIKAAQEFNPSGFALWRLGSEDPSIWTFYGRTRQLDQGAAAQLRVMRYGYDLDYEGRGEILYITDRPKEGKRDITFDGDRGLITSEKITDFPSPYIITRYGAADHKLALTFDDGPDPAATPAILDILRRENAPATFFVIGLAAEQHQDLLKREVADGHEIGNHTFTHPNIAEISATQFNLELSATQTLFESLIRRRSYLFRPPYAEDSEPQTLDEVAPLDMVGAKNYLTVGMTIDPKDWLRPGVDKIIQNTIDGAVGDANKGRLPGNVILLHDSGGDRSETIEALPIMIEQLRARGFQFVTVSDLMGRTRDEVMPPITSQAQWQAWTNRATFGIVNLAMTVVDWLFLIGIVLGIGRLGFIGTLAVYERWRERHSSYDPNYAPTVAVVVPAYNEEKVIVQTITSLLASDHPPVFEIVVVDDGSTDDTYVRVRDVFSNEPRVRLYTKPNGGKPTALNFGVSCTDAEIVVALDADTIFARDTISKLVRHFADPKIGAVAGNAKVGNRINLLTRWQALEYVTSQNLDRRAFETLNCITVVPGAVGAWRRELLIRAGGFTHFTLAEDADLTMTIRRMGYSIAYDDQAIALTEAPDTVRAFIRQRYRWMYGTLQAAWKHIDALFKPRYGSLGFVALPNIFIFQVFFPLISPAMDLLMLVTLVTTAFDRFQHPAEFSADTLWRVLFYYALFMAVEFLAAMLAFALEPKENKRLLVWLFWQRFFYRQLMYYVAIKSTLASLRGISVGWSKLERKATVKT
jgi:cellulose synthase/poly-beta-1,6-N-acetylglucosamine synthase-like glycosyltransferase/spore germination protein YaaH/peptidoglycan/xylan/chitin deacetylase (PgdA/CDA1 family)